MIFTLSPDLQGNVCKVTHTQIYQQLIAIGVLKF